MKPFFDGIITNSSLTVKDFLVTCIQHDIFRDQGGATVQLKLVFNLAKQDSAGLKEPMASSLGI